MRLDVANHPHPDWDDIPSTAGYLHIAGCEQCTLTFDGPILWYAREEQAREDNASVARAWDNITAEQAETLRNNHHDIDRPSR